MGDIFFPSYCKQNQAGGKMSENNINYTLKENILCHHSKKCNVCLATTKYLKFSDFGYFLNAHEMVTASGMYNYENCKIPVNFRMNLDFIRSWLVDYKDKKVCDFLEYGFPIGAIESNTILKNVTKTELWKFKNHKGAKIYPEDINKYLQKEAINKAILGPFKNNPFSSGIKISPLNSVPKKETTERRVILDLSFPKGSAVNDFISKKEYLGQKMEIIFPKVDDFIQLIKSKGRNCLLYKVDLR